MGVIENLKQTIIAVVAEIDAAINVIRQRSEMSAQAKDDLEQAIDTLDGATQRLTEAVNSVSASGGSSTP